MTSTEGFDLNVTRDYVETPYLNHIIQRAMLYLDSGYPIHLRGSAGVGKTSTAIHIAGLIGNPVLFMSGSEGVNNDNLIGGFFGIRSMLVEDNFISTVYKKEEQLKKTWNDGRLLTACRNGYTVIYDEFTRARPEMNNVLMSILEEKIVDVPYDTSANTFRKVSPDFRIIFTSNPDEYVGVYSSPNALLDRMITIDMDAMDEQTQADIVAAKSGIGRQAAMNIVVLTRLVRNHVGANGFASLRSSIMLARIVRSGDIRMHPANELFRMICHDVYNTLSGAAGKNPEDRLKLTGAVNKAIGLVMSE